MSRACSCLLTAVVLGGIVLAGSTLAEERAYFGGLTDNEGNRIVSTTATLIATDATALAGGAIVEVRTNFGTAGVDFKACVYRPAGGNSFEFVAASETLQSVAGFHSYTTVVYGVQPGDYLGVVVYLEGQQICKVAYTNASSSYFYYPGEHLSGVQEYTPYTEIATVCIDARVGIVPPTATASPIPSPTPTAVPTASPTVTATPTEPPPTLPPTATIVPPSPTMSPLPSATPTATPTFTATPTPSPTMTPTPTRTATGAPTATAPPPSPTATPAATETPPPTPLPLGVTIEMSSTYFRAGDRFLVRAWLSNPGAGRFPARFYFLLEVYGQFYFWPSWSRQEDYIVVQVDPGRQVLQILDFTWPSGVGSAEGLAFWAAMLETVEYEIIGDLDVVYWGYGP
jgi:hypothetical protein